MQGLDLPTFLVSKKFSFKFLSISSSRILSSNLTGKYIAACIKPFHTEIQTIVFSFLNFAKPGLSVFIVTPFVR